MANIRVKNAQGEDVYLAATGAGTDGDPHVPTQAVTEINSGDILTHLQAVVAALAGTLTVDGAVTVDQTGIINALSALLSELQDKADVDQTQPVSLETLPDTAGGTLAGILAALASVAVTGPLTDAQLRAAAVPVGVGLPSTLYHGQTVVAAAGTEVALAASQTLVSGVTVKAKHANTGMIYVGANPVTSTTGFELAAGEQVFVETANLANVYVDAAVSGEGVSWLAA